MTDPTDAEPRADWLAELHRMRREDQAPRPGSRTMTDRLTPQRHPLDAEALIQALVAERNQLTADLAEARRQVEAACCGPWHDYETSQRDEAAFPWGRVNAARAVADQWRTYAFEHIDGVPGAQTPGWAVALTALNLVCRELDDDGMRPAADPGKPHAAPQPHAEPPAAGSAGNEASETPSEAQRPAEGVEPSRCPAPNPLFLGEFCSLAAGHTGDHRDGRGGGWPNRQPPQPNIVQLRRRTPEERHAYLAGRRAEAIARGIPAELIDMFIADAQAELDAGIAPEDEGISTADVHAQTASDELADLTGELRDLTQTQLRELRRISRYDGTESEPR